MSEIEKEILEESKNIQSNIITEIIHVPGSLDKELLKAELLKNGYYNQLRHEGII